MNTEPTTTIDEPTITKPAIKPEPLERRVRFLELDIHERDRIHAQAIGASWLWSVVAVCILARRIQKLEKRPGPDGHYLLERVEELDRRMFLHLHPEEVTHR